MVASSIRAMTTEPQTCVLRPPRTRIEGFSIVGEDGSILLVPQAPLHLVCDESGQFPLTSLNKWEHQVVLSELARPNVLAWYRNLRGLRSIHSASPTVMISLATGGPCTPISCSFTRSGARLSHLSWTRTAPILTTR